MLLLADESLDFTIVRALQAVNHNVLAVSEISPGAEDVYVMNLAFREARILLTEDKDFGQLGRDLPAIPCIIPKPYCRRCCQTLGEVRRQPAWMLRCSSARAEPNLSHNPRLYCCIENTQSLN